nr:uncharacterized protein LOC127338858 [Lolium perenne]
MSTKSDRGEAVRLVLTNAGSLHAHVVRTRRVGDRRYAVLRRESVASRSPESTRSIVAVVELRRAAPTRSPASSASLWSSPPTSISPRRRGEPLTSPCRSLTAALLVSRAAGERPAIIPIRLRRMHRSLARARRHQDKSPRPCHRLEVAPAGGRHRSYVRAALSRRRARCCRRRRLHHVRDAQMGQPSPPRHPLTVPVERRPSQLADNSRWIKILGPLTSSSCPTQVGRPRSVQPKYFRSQPEKIRTPPKKKIGIIPEIRR